MLPGLHDEVARAAIAADQRQPPHGGAVAAHHRHVRADADEHHGAVGRQVFAADVLPWHLDVREWLLLFAFVQDHHQLGSNHKAYSGCRMSMTELSGDRSSPLTCCLGMSGL